MSEFNVTPVEQVSEIHDGERYFTVPVHKARKMQTSKFTFRVIGKIGKGTFGTVQKVITPEGEQYAMKEVEFDPRYKNREVSIMRMLDHPNCCRLFYYYVEKNPGTELAVRLIMELYPTSMAAFVASHRQKKEDMPEFYIRLYLYQLLRGVAYLHQEEIAHRYVLLNLSSDCMEPGISYCRPNTPRTQPRTHDSKLGARAYFKTVTHFPET